MEIVIDPDAANHPFGVYDAALRRWKILPGDYRVMVGVSSAEILTTKTVTLAG